VLAVKTPPDFTSSVRGGQGARRNHDKSTTLDIHTILHPTDFSSGSDYAFELACVLAEKFAARLILLHVLLPSSQPFPGDQPYNPLLSAEGQECVKGRFNWPQPLNQQLSVEHRLAEGDSSEEILRLADAGHCDLIVMGTQGRTGLQRMVIGSVAEEVLRMSASPVMAVKTPPGWCSSVRYSDASTPCEIVDVRPLGAAAIVSARRKSNLLKTDTVEVVRLVVPKDATVSENMVQEETLFQCLEGKVAFTANGKTQILETGNLLYLPGGEGFAIKALADASLLLTILVP
jgi:nucleotide-binding universal stress UspA family protein/quercetin dioxygenase-like cupin family protein